MSESKPNMVDVLKSAGEIKLNKTPAKKESAVISDRTKLISSIKKGSKLEDTSQALAKAEDINKRAVVKAYKAEKKSN